MLNKVVTNMKEIENMKDMHDEELAKEYARYVERLQNGPMDEEDIAWAELVEAERPLVSPETQRAMDMEDEERDYVREVERRRKQNNER
jgi:hypothetical protein